MIPFIFIALALFALIIWRDMKMGIFLILTALPTYLIRFDISVIPVTLLEIFIIIAILVWIFKHHGLHVIGPFLKGWRLPILLILTAATIGTIVSPDPISGIGIWKAYIIEPLLFFFVVRTTLKTKTDVKHALMALGAGAIAVSAFGIIQYFTGLGIPSPWDIEKRITSFYEFPNAVGLYLAPIVTLGIVQLVYPLFKPFQALRSPKALEEVGLRRVGRQEAMFWLAVVILGILALFFSKTEAAWVAIPASILMVSFFIKGFRKWTIPLTVMLVVLSLSIPATRQKLLLQDYSGEVRRGQWTETVELLKDKPLFGAGLSGYPIAFEPYHRLDYIEIFQYPHNIFLNIWVELGLLGLLAFLIIAWQVLRLVVVTPSARARGWGDPTPIALAIFAALLTMFTHGLVDVPYFKNDLAIMTWTLLALLGSAAVLETKKRPD